MPKQRVISMRMLPAMLLIVALWADGLAIADESAIVVSREADTEFMQLAFQRSCVKCHGQNGEEEADVDLLNLKTADDMIAAPALLRDLIDVLDSDDMPPEDEPPLSVELRKELVRRLKELLRIALGSSNPLPRAPLRRMNRFQYNNAVQDLFQLDVVVFPLPERILREYGDYFQPATGKMPEQLKAGSRPLGKSQLIEQRLAGVTPFPQDLRAEHGFDNQADHLSLSPLLLESLL